LTQIPRCIILAIGTIPNPTTQHYYLQINIIRLWEGTKETK